SAEARRAGALAAHTGMAEPVVPRTLLGVPEDGVGFGSLLEAFFGAGVTGISVGVELECQAPVGALEFLVGGGPRNTENFVIIAHGLQAFATRTREARSRRSPIRYPRRISPVIWPSGLSPAGSVAIASCHSSSNGDPKS